MAKLPKMVTTEERDSWSRGFATIAMSYYALGRMGVRAGLSPACGNMLHHAVERWLKALLVRESTESPADLARISHDLVELWERARAIRPTLDPFRATIEGLDRFDEIRYPDKWAAPAGPGVTIAISVRPNTPMFRPPQNPSWPAMYELVLNDVDDLVAALLDVCEIDPQFAILSNESLEAIRGENPHAKRWREPNNLEAELRAQVVAEFADHDDGA